MNISYINFDFDTLSLTITCDTGSDNIKLDCIKIDNQDTFVCKNDASEFAAKKEFFTHTRSASEVFNFDTEPIVSKDNLLIIYVYVFNEDNISEVAAVIPCFNEKLLYNKIYNLIKDDFKTCNVCDDDKMNSISNICMFYGLNFALNSGNIHDAINIWNSLTDYNLTNNKCNCK